MIIITIKNQFYNNYAQNIKIIIVTKLNAEGGGKKTGVGPSGRGLALPFRGVWVGKSFLLPCFFFSFFIFFIFTMFHSSSFLVFLCRSGSWPFVFGLGLALPPSFSDCGLALLLRGGPSLSWVGEGQHPRKDGPTHAPRKEGS